MELWTAFLLGFAGSAHCAGMCGPLALALPVVGTGPWGHGLSRLAYNAGRVATYAALGVVFGLIGRTLAVAGLQRWVSIGAGAVLLLAVAVPRWRLIGNSLVLPVGWLKGALGALLRRRGVGSLFLLGLLNGLLPCGLVYVACAAAAATGALLTAVEYMAVFGLGTTPMMLALSLAGTLIQPSMRLRFQRLVPVSLALVGVLLVLRGLGLGIPYVSPNLTGSGGPACCH